MRDANPCLRKETRYDLPIVCDLGCPMRGMLRPLASRVKLLYSFT